MDFFMIECRKRTLTPTANSQRRCYNGCFPSSDWEQGWTEWDWISLKLTEKEAQKKLEFWKSLNDFAVKERGLTAKKQFRIVPDTVYDGTW